MGRLTIGNRHYVPQTKESRFLARLGLGIRYHALHLGELGFGADWASVLYIMYSNLGELCFWKD